METQRVGTQIKATFSESQWGGTATFSMTFDSKADAQQHADEEGLTLFNTKEVEKWEVV